MTTTKPSETDNPDANRFRRHEALLSERWPNRARRSGRLKAACLAFAPDRQINGATQPAAMAATEILVRPRRRLSLNQAACRKP